MFTNKYRPMHVVAWCADRTGQMTRPNRAVKSRFGKDDAERSMLWVNRTVLQLTSECDILC